MGHVAAMLRPTGRRRRRGSGGLPAFPACRAAALLRHQARVRRPHAARAQGARHRRVRTRRGACASQVRRLLYVTLDDQFEPGYRQRERPRRVDGQRRSTARRCSSCDAASAAARRHRLQGGGDAPRRLVPPRRLPRPPSWECASRGACPSHILGTLHSTCGCAATRLRVRSFSGVAVYKRVSGTIGLDNRTFFDADGDACSFISTGKRGAPSIHIMAYTETGRARRGARRNSVRETRRRRLAEWSTSGAAVLVFEVSFCK